MMASPIHTSIRFRPDALIAGGESGFVYDLDAVVKLAKPDRVEHHTVECAIYLRLGLHPRIVDVYLTSQGRQKVIVLEKMETSLRDFLQRPKPQRLSDDVALDYAIQLAEGYAFLHGKSVYHVDIGAHNVLINPSRSCVKLCDFAGSSLDGSIPLVYANARAQCPWSDTPHVATELFSFGSLLYELSTAYEPYKDKSLSAVKELYRQKQFPTVSHLIMGPVILKCWTGEYCNATDVLDDLRSLQKKREQCSSISEAVLHQRSKYGGLFLSLVICVLVWRKRKC